MEDSKSRTHPSGSLQLHLKAVILLGSSVFGYPLYCEVEPLEDEGFCGSFRFLCQAFQRSILIRQAANVIVHEAIAEVSTVVPGYVI
jgi:hypothetical protein